MNEKECKKMRRAVRGFIALYGMDPALFKQVYRAIKKGERNEVKLARFKATPNQLVERTPLIYKEAQNDVDNRRY